MKETRFRFLRILLPLAVAAMSVTACVEDEQAPFSDGDEGLGGYINVKLPSYGYFYPGSVVMLRGSGFSGSDRVLVQNDDGIDGDASTGSGQDNNGDGQPDVMTEVEATVQSYSDDYLCFIIPGEITYSDAIVYIVRDGVKYEIGLIRVTMPYLSNCYQDGDMTLIELGGYDFDGSDHVYLRAIGYDDDGNMVVSSVLQEANVTGTDYSLLTAEACLIGDAQVWWEHNGEMSYAGMATANTGHVVQLPSGYEFTPGETLTMSGQCFLDGDRIELYSIDRDEYSYAETTVTDSGISFTVPAPANGYSESFFVFIERGGVRINLGWNFMTIINAN